MTDRADRHIMTEDEARALPWPDRVRPYVLGHEWSAVCNGPWESPTQKEIAFLACAVANGYLPRAVLDHAIAASKGEEWPGAALYASANQARDEAVFKNKELRRRVTELELSVMRMRHENALLRETLDNWRSLDGRPANTDDKRDTLRVQSVATRLKERDEAIGQRKAHGRRITELEQENAALRHTLDRWRSLDGRRVDLGDRYDERRVEALRTKIQEYRVTATRNVVESWASRQIGASDDYAQGREEADGEFRKQRRVLMSAISARAMERDAAIKERDAARADFHAAMARLNECRAAAAANDWTPERKEAAVGVAREARRRGWCLVLCDVIDPPPALPEIEPCPRCGGECYVPDHPRKVAHCRGLECSWLGPVGDTERAAIEAHNREAHALRAALEEVPRG